nr:uncharacterized mitochondrial protein AtMg00810-like [Tanacetum cinerariifolium]
MIGSLMHLTSSRPDIMFVVYACARFQVNPKILRLHTVKRIFRYLKDQPKLGLWYHKDSPFDLVAYTDSNYARASLDRKSTTGCCQFLGCRLISWQCKKKNVVANSTTEAEYVAASSCCGQAKTVNEEAQLQALLDGKKVIITKSTIKRDLQLEDVEGVDCLPNVAIFKQLTLIGFVQVFLNNQLEEMTNHNRIYVTPSHIKKIFGNMRRVGKDFSGRVTPLFSTMMKKHKSRKLKRKDNELPKTSISTSVADEAVNEEIDDSLERAATTATSLDAEWWSQVPRSHGDVVAQTRSERVSKISSDPLLIGVNIPQSGEDSLKLTELMELYTNLQQRVLALETTKTTQALEIDSLKRIVKKLERRKRSRTHGLIRLYKVGLSKRVESSEDKGLGKEDASKQGRIADFDVNEDIYLVNVYTDKDIFGVNDDDVIVKDAKMLFDVADDLRGEEIESWDDVQAKIDADYELSQILQAKEQDELTDAEKAKLFMEFLEKRRKFFDAKRTEEKRNRPPT